MRPPAREKRAAQRIGPYVAPCRLRSAERALLGYVIDLSLRGARVLCEQVPPPAGTTVTLEIRFKGRPTHSRLTAEVKWVRPSLAGETAPQGQPGRSGYTLGLAFVTVSADDRALIEGVVETFRQRAARLAERN